MTRWTEESQATTEAVELPSRRRFLQVSAGVGGALVVGVPLAMAAGAPTAGAVLEPNAFVRIDKKGLVTVIVPYVEMGQGTYTSLPMLIAEELEVPMSQVRFEHAPPNDKLYYNPLLGFQVTGGSTTIRATFTPMRQAGAAARVLLVQAAAARWGVPVSECRASQGKVLHAGSGRSLAYGALVADAAKLTVPKELPLKSPADFQLIGRPAKRLDTPAKVNGTARYGIDAWWPGMAFATLQQSPTFGGRLRRVDDSAALKVKGVRKVVKLDDAVAVVADHMGAAKKGLAALVIEWDDGANAKVSSESIRASMAQAAQGAGARARNDGDAEAGLAQAARRVEAVYELPFLIHATMEPMNCTVDLRADGCDIWLGTQVITRAQAAAAQVSGLPLDKVTVHNHVLGGGFGRRLEVDYVVRAVQIAREVKGPVKVVWTREEDVRQDMYKPAFYDVVRAGLDAQGQPLAWHHRLTGSSVIKRWAPPLYKDGLDPETIDGAADLMYRVPNVRVEYVNHEPPVPTSFWRGVGPAHNIFVVESFIDELAHAAGQDPVKWREQYLAHQPRALKVLREAARQSGWGTPLSARQGRGIAVMQAFGTFMATVAQVQVGDDGEVTVQRLDTVVDTGIVVNPDTVVAQVEGAQLFGLSAALWGGATIKDGKVEQSNFHDVRVVRMNEAPLMKTTVLSSQEGPGGIGEPGTAIVGPAIFNAVFAATGVRQRKMPLDPALMTKKA